MVEFLLCGSINQPSPRLAVPGYIFLCEGQFIRQILHISRNTHSTHKAQVGGIIQTPYSKPKGNAYLLSTFSYLRTVSVDFSRVGPHQLHHVQTQKTLDEVSLSIFLLCYSFMNNSAMGNKDSPHVFVTQTIIELLQMST